MTVKDFAERLSPEAQELFIIGSSTVAREQRALLDELEAAGLIDFEGTQPVQLGLKTVAAAYAMTLTKNGETLWHDLLRFRPKE
jgi:hypothetical protein